MTDIEKKENLSNKKADPKVVEEVLNNPDIQEEVNKRVDREAEEKAKKMFLRKKIEESDTKTLSKKLNSFSKFDDKEFKGIVADREKLIGNISNASISDLEEFANRIDTAKRVEREFKLLDAREEEEDIGMPIHSVKESSLPDNLDKIAKNPDNYDQFRIGHKFYQTNDPHKEFEEHEKRNLVSLFDDSSMEATQAWQKEYLLSARRNKTHINNILQNVT